MGFMTEISILNDDWDRFERMIREEPEKLIQELRTLQNGRPQYGPENPETGRREYLGLLDHDRVHGVYVTVFRSHHADEARLYLAHQNAFRSLDPYHIEREFGERLDRQPWLIDVLDREVKIAENKLKGLKEFLKEKRAEVKEAEVA